MKVQVLGSGCTKCKKLYAEAEKAILEAGLPAQLEKVESIDEIIAFGVMATPALVLDGEVKSSGRMPPASEIASWLRLASDEADSMTAAAWRKSLARSSAVVLLVAAGGFALSACQKKEADRQPAADEKPTASATESGSDAEDATLSPDTIYVYYFHSDRRCKTCLSIQKAIQSTVNGHFSEASQSGSLVFKEINTNQPENEHYIEDFQLSSSSMLLVSKRGDKRLEWENCSRVWPLAHNEEKLSGYIETQIRSYLAKLQDS